MTPTSAGSTADNTWIADPRGDTLQQRIQQQQLAIDTVVWAQCLHSTNEHAKQYINTSGDAGNVLVMSNQQTAGKGQSGRVWQSPEGNLYLSLLTTLQHPVSGRLALEVAIAILSCPLLAEIDGLCIKWPNDLYHQDAKWGGILIEPVSTHQVIIGVGINLSNMHTHVADQAVTDLSSIAEQNIDVLDLAVQTSVALLHACEQFDHGSIALSTRFAAVDYLLQAQVGVSVAGQAPFKGVAMGVCPDGALIVQHNTQTQKFYSGHVRKLTAHSTPQQQ